MARFAIPLTLNLTIPSLVMSPVRAGALPALTVKARSAASLDLTFRRNVTVDAIAFSAKGGKAYAGSIAGTAQCVGDLPEDVPCPCNFLIIASARCSCSIGSSLREAGARGSGIADNEPGENGTEPLRNGRDCSSWEPGAATSEARDLDDHRHRAARFFREPRRCYGRSRTRVEEVVGMLAMSSHAAQAITELVSQPGVPDGAGIKLSPQETPEGVAIELSLVEGPIASDQVVQEGGARLFVAQDLAPELDDKLLDADVEAGQVSFQLKEQAPGAPGATA